MGATRTMHQEMGLLQLGCPQTGSSSTPKKPNSSAWLGTMQQLAKLNRDALSAELSTMAFSPLVGYLGLLIDSQLTFSHHIDQVCRSCCYQLRQLRVIARSSIFTLFKLLYSAASTTAVSSSLVSPSQHWGRPMSITKLSPNWACQMGPIHLINFLLSGPGVRMEKLRRDLLAASRSLQHIPVYAGCIALASIPTAHLVQDRVLGVGGLGWLGALFSARALLPSLFLCRRWYIAVLCPR